MNKFTIIISLLFFTYFSHGQDPILTATGVDCDLCDSAPSFCATPPEPNTCTYYYDANPATGSPAWFNSSGSVIATPQNIQANDKVCIFVDNSDLTLSNFQGTVFIGAGATFSGNIASTSAGAEFQIAGTFQPSNIGQDPNQVTFRICETGVANLPPTNGKIGISAQMYLYNYNGEFTVNGELNFNANSHVLNCRNGVAGATGTDPLLTLDGKISNCGLLVSDGDIRVNGSANIYNDCSLWAKGDSRLDTEIENDGIYVVEGLLVLNDGIIDQSGGGKLVLGDLESRSANDAITGMSGQVFIDGVSTFQDASTYSDQLWCENYGTSGTCQGPSECGDPNVTCSNLMIANIAVGYDSPADAFVDDCGQVLALVLSSLPLEFLDVTVMPLSNGNLLQWTTANEINTQDFEVQVSIDGVTFETIAQIESADTRGEQNYEFVDPTAYPSNIEAVYYRLKQNDIDGAYSYSSVVAIANTSMARTDNQVYPTILSKGELINVIGADIRSIEVYDVTGKLVYAAKGNLYATSQEIKLDVDSGMYFMRLDDKTIKIVVRD